MNSISGTTTGSKFTQVLAGIVTVAASVKDMPFVLKVIVVLLFGLLKG
jgi:hypothetical protein